MKVFIYKYIHSHLMLIVQRMSEMFLNVGKMLQKKLGRP